jgi:hypothetical protein
MTRIFLIRVILWFSVFLCDCDLCLDRRSCFISLFIFTVDSGSSTLFLSFWSQFRTTVWFLLLFWVFVIFIWRFSSVYVFNIFHMLILFLFNFKNFRDFFRTCHFTRFIFIGRLRTDFNQLRVFIGSWDFMTSLIFIFSSRPLSCFGPKGSLSIPFYIYVLLPQSTPFLPPSNPRSRLCLFFPFIYLNCCSFILSRMPFC